MKLKSIVGISFSLSSAWRRLPAQPPSPNRLQYRERIDVLDLYTEVAADAEEAIDAGSR